MFQLGLWHHVLVSCVVSSSVHFSCLSLLAFSNGTSQSMLLMFGESMAPFGSVFGMGLESEMFLSRFQKSIPYSDCLVIKSIPHSSLLTPLSSPLSLLMAEHHHHGCSSDAIIIVHRRRHIRPSDDEATPQFPSCDTTPPLLMDVHHHNRRRLTLSSPPFRRCCNLYHATFFLSPCVSGHWGLLRLWGSIGRGGSGWI